MLRRNPVANFDVVFIVLLNFRSRANGLENTVGANDDSPLRLPII
jgi:hypothetical protein